MPCLWDMQIPWTVSLTMLLLALLLLLLPVLLLLLLLPPPHHPPHLHPHPHARSIQCLAESLTCCSCWCRPPPPPSLSDGASSNGGFRYFWLTDSCPQTVKAINGASPFEVLSLADLIGSALQI
jgi:hypothetical protein